MPQSEVFAKLSEIKLPSQSKKNGRGKLIQYADWAAVIAAASRTFSSFRYETVKNKDGNPWMFDEKLGYYVATLVTFEGVTHEMWLPVFDNHYMAMKDHPYEAETRNGTIRVNAADIGDINRALMRCLVKNIATFGLGISFYEGEYTEDENENRGATMEEISEEQKAAMETLLQRKGKKLDLSQITPENYDGVMKRLMALPDPEAAAEPVPEESPEEGPGDQESEIELPDDLDARGITPEQYMHVLDLLGRKGKSTDMTKLNNGNYAKFVQRLEGLPDKPEENL